MFNLFKAYIQAWSDYRENDFMKVATLYLNKALDRNDLADLMVFHEHYTIKRGHYYGVDEDYAIGDNSGTVVWKGDYPTEEVIKKIIDEWYG